MTLAGTRPILQDELLKYELHHRARIAIKPGMKTTLLIMAAGIGSRFGTGIKQLEPVDDAGHIIMDYSIEMLQLLLRLGTFQLSDIFYNTVGGVLGGLMYCAVMKARKRL